MGADLNFKFIFGFILFLTGAGVVGQETNISCLKDFSAIEIRTPEPRIVVSENSKLLARISFERNSGRARVKFFKWDEKANGFNLLETFLLGEGYPQKVVISDAGALLAVYFILYPGRSDRVEVWDIKGKKVLSYGSVNNLYKEQDSLSNYNDFYLKEENQCYIDKWVCRGCKIFFAEGYDEFRFFDAAGTRFALPGK